MYLEGGCALKVRWGDIPEWAISLTQTLLNALKERDPYTYGHCRRVAYTARRLAEAAGLNAYQVNIVEYSSLFHDLGKLGISDGILLKPGRLTMREEAIMRAHPVKGAEILTPLTHVRFFKDLIPGILHHHERMDGAGYPSGIFGDQIPLEARVILIADTFDAMTTTRPYRNGLPVDIAYKELKLFAGRQFDPHLVKIFIESHPSWQKFEEEISEEFLSAQYKKAA
jgi:HD-GYP domain-containing protein (c-di-GMP phosphodiesterase class II)